MTDIPSFNEEILKVVKDIRYLLEQIAQKRGDLGRRNEAKIREYLITNGKATKQEICSFCNVSDTAALKIMKRLDKKGGIVYIPGLGRHPSLLFYDDGKSLESKAIRLLKLMPRKSMLTKEEVTNKLGIELREFNRVIDIAARLTDGEIFFQYDKVVRGR